MRDDIERRVIIIAGPNGAGKTTFAREFLPLEADCLLFVNADLIAAGLSPLAPERAAIQAGKLMLRSIAEHARRRESFAFETTLSGLGYARQIPIWRQSGYRVELFFLSLPDPEAGVARVRQRVAQGGHDIPEPVIRRRFASGRRLFDSVYKPLVDEWALYDSAGDEPVLLDWSTNMKRGPAVHEVLPPYPGLPTDASPALKGSYQALLRAAARARQLARQTGTDLVLVRNGRVVKVPPGSA